MPRIALVLIFACLATTACSDGSPPATEAAPAPAAQVKLYVFDCGRILLDSTADFGIEESETEVREMSVPCYVVEHPAGRLLWDGGLPSSTADTPGWQGEGMRLRLERTFADQLAALELDMGSFDYMAFSHFHFDHIGVANEVEGATLLIHPAEYAAAFAPEVTTPGFQPPLYENLRDAPRVELEADHDVFGDGRVRIIAAPGHTPGHQVLYVELTETGPLVLSGDLYHFKLSRQERRVPTFNVDAAQTLASMEQVEALVAETGAAFWIEHELAHFETLDLAPLYYQ